MPDSTFDPDAPPPPDDPETVEAITHVLTLASMLVGVWTNRDGMLSARQRDKAHRDVFAWLTKAVERLHDAQPVYGQIADREISGLLAMLAEDVADDDAV